MKSLYALAAIVAFSAVPAFAAEGHVSSNSLAKMGLADMKSMNDAQGMTVRGTSVAVVFGLSHATISGEGGSASSVNGYFAAGHHSANGTNVSFAASGDITTHGDYTRTSIDFVAAGGASSAHAH
ncbi:MAG TPA: hypothetical protein VGP63_24585 [Planctomycetaceae bacterium]|jgi:hypothetical protein|nr:hypothetical protein [Planctomycetaceae bacterium]